MVNVAGRGYGELFNTVCTTLTQRRPTPGQKEKTGHTVAKIEFKTQMFVVADMKVSNVDLLVYNKFTISIR